MTPCPFHLGAILLELKVPTHASNIIETPLNQRWEVSTQAFQLHTQELELVTTIPFIVLFGFLAAIS